MSQRIAEAFLPGDFIREEMTARLWSQRDLAHILNLEPSALNKLLAGKKKVSARIAEKLANAFGTSPELWMNYQTTFDLRHQDHRDETVARRAHLYSKAPVREMIKRGWIGGSDSIEVLEKRVADFLGVRGVAASDEPPFLHAARASIDFTAQQRAWLCRAKQLAETLTVDRFSQDRLRACIDGLKGLMREPEDIRQVPCVFGEAGIRFVVVEPLPNARIDGACFWLSGFAPVIAMSLRYDRIDSFWHTLLHELGHIRYEHALSIDDLDNPTNESDEEKKADGLAEAAAVDQRELVGFIARVGPIYSVAQVRGFAAELSVHPGVVIGQLHRRGELECSQGRVFLVPVRAHLVSAALTDGWGALLPSDFAGPNARQGERARVPDGPQDGLP